MFPTVETIQQWKANKCRSFIKCIEPIRISFGISMRRNIFPHYLSVYPANLITFHRFEPSHKNQKTLIYYKITS